MTFRPGAMIGGRYRLVSRIAGGGMGEVWRADDTVLERTVAIKLLRQELADDPTFLARFRDEARHTAGLTHPGIAAVHDYGETDDDGRVVAWMVMEYVDGEPLSRRIKRDGALPPVQVLDVVAQTALALQVAHDAGVVHRDVKPANLLVRPDGVVKVTDFGIARAAGGAGLTRAGTIVGTAQYLSPEQASGGQASAASDVYGLGVVAYEALTARRPFDGDSQLSVALAHANEPVPALPSGIPDPVRDLVDRMLAKAPADRPLSAAEVAAEALAVRALLDDGDAPPVPGARGAAAGAAGYAADPPGGTRVLTAPVAAPAAGGTPGRGLPWLGWRDYPRIPSLVALGALLLLVALLAYACAAAGAGSTPQPKPTPAPTPATVTVDPAQYVGQPYASVANALSALGLVPVRHDQVGAGTPGTVSSVAPTGTVQRGATITVTVVVAPPPPPAGDNGNQQGPGGKGDHGKGKDH